jgi:hypothetical protein
MGWSVLADFPNKHQKLRFNKISLALTFGSFGQAKEQRIVSEN